MNSISFRRFAPQDIPCATAIMKAAFDEDSALFCIVHDAPSGYPHGSLTQYQRYLLSICKININSLK